MPDDVLHPKRMPCARCGHVSISEEGFDVLHAKPKPGCHIDGSECPKAVRR